MGADPSPIGAVQPGGWAGLRYWRLHGSPRLYHSAYGPERVQAYARLLSASVEDGIPTWCIFDNTASGAAVSNALALQALVADETAWSP